MTDDAQTLLYPVILNVPEASPSTPLRLEDRREKTKFLSALARRALIRSCALGGLSCPADFPKAENGAPIPVDGVYWSLSHKPCVAGGIAAREPVGMDLETIRTVHPGLFSKVADAAEWSLFPGGHNPMNFFRVWTAKEAVLKAVGIGFSGISRCRVRIVPEKEKIGDAHMTLSFDHARWRVLHHCFGDHMAAVTVPRGFLVKWEILEFESSLCEPTLEKTGNNDKNTISPSGLRNDMGS